MNRRTRSAKSPPEGGVAAPVPALPGWSRNLIETPSRTAPHDPPRKISVLYFRLMNLNNVGEASLPTKFGTFRIHFGFETEDHSDAALALVMGEPASCDAPLVRIHSQCLTGDVLHSSRCDCGEQLELAQKSIAAEGHG